MRTHAYMLRGILSLLFLWLTLVSWAQNPQWEWARSIGTSAWEVAKQVAVDPATRHVYVVGDWEDDLSGIFPGGANPSTQFNATYGLMDGFVAKYDEDGNLVWAFKLGGADDDRLNSIALDQGGNIYITGMMGEAPSIYFSGTSPHTGSSTLSNTSDRDFFLAKYNPDGEFLWVRRSTTNFGDLIGQDVTLTSDAVYAVGTATGWASFGSLWMATTPGIRDIFLVKYSLDGNELWIAEAGSNGIDLVNEVVADESHVFYIGHFEGSNLNIRHAGGGNASSESNAGAGFSDIVLVSYDQTGTYAWSETIASADHDEGQGMTMDADSLYITGAIHNNASFPSYAGNPLSTSAQRDIFLASLAKSDGATGWVQVLPCTDPGDERGRCVDIDAVGNLFVIGDFKSELQFPEGVTLSAISGDDVFVAAFRANGNFLWAESAGSSLLDEGNGLALGVDGSVYISGRHDQQMTLGSIILPDNPGRNGFLAKLQDAVNAPSNDLPCAALLLPVTDTCAPALHSNLGASDSGIPDPGCATYAGADIWFKAIVPPSGNLFVGTHTTNDDVYPPVDGYMWNVAMALYTGACGSLNLQACYESNSAYNSRASSAYLFDQVPGDTLWIRVWEPNGDDNGMFSICCYDPGHFPGWDLPENICEETGAIDLAATLSELKTGFADVLVDAVGIPNPGNALGTTDGNGASLDDIGDRIILDLNDTIPAGETYSISLRSNPLVSGETHLVFKTSLDNLTYIDHSFQPETSADLYDSYFITAEHPTRYLWIENNDAGGGGFQFDGAEYLFRGTRGGTWSGPGVSGSMFDPAGLQGTVSLSYVVGGTVTLTDSIRTTFVMKSDAGTLGNDTTVCSDDLGLVLDLQGYTGTVVAWQSSTNAFLDVITLPITDSFLSPSGLTESIAYRVIVQDGSCDPDTSNVLTVTVVDMLPADPGPYGDVCGSSLGLQAIPSTGTGAWSILSGPGNATFTPSGNVPSVSVEVDQYGIYTLTWTETNGLCSDDSTFVVEFYEPSLADPGIGGDTCSFSFALNATPSVGSGRWSVQSGPGSATFLPSDAAPDAVVTVSESGNYELLWTESNGRCSDDSVIVVNFLETPVAHAGTGGESCGSAFQLSALPSIGTGIWTKTAGPGTASFTPFADDPEAIVSVDMPGIYQFTWAESNALCADQQSIEVDFLETLVLEAGANANVCGLQHDLNVLPRDIPGSWITSYGPGNSSFAPSETEAMARVTVDAYGEYMFKWEVSQGFCKGEDSLIIVFGIQPSAEAGPDQVLDHTFSAYLEAVAPSATNTTGTWTLLSGSGIFADSNDPTSQVSGLDLGENVFVWTLSSEFCLAVSDQVMITVNDIETYTVITPNNDGLNDVLVFPGIEELDECEIIIYNRWGIEVYRNQNYQNNWEGRDHKDRSLIEDTYYYVLKIPPDRIIKSFVEIRRSK